MLQKKNASKFLNDELVEEIELYMLQRMFSQGVDGVTRNNFITVFKFRIT